MRKSRFSHSSLPLFCLFGLSVLVAGCAIELQPEPAPEAAADSESEPEVTPELQCPTISAFLCDNDKLTGISGSAKISDNEFLVVHDQIIAGPGDNDDNKVVPRIRVLWANTAGTGYSFVPTTVDWTTAGRISNDAESACRLDGLAGNQFLVAESGSWVNDYGHVFHVELVQQHGQDPHVTVKSGERITLPGLTKTDRSSVQQFEGLACHKVGDDKYLVVLGERGDHKSEADYKQGKLRWGSYIPSTMTMTWDSASIVDVVAPQRTSNHADEVWRDITGLHIDADQRLWASAAYDGDDTNNKVYGPFNSVVYQLGYICVDQNDGHGHTADCTYDKTKPRYPKKLTSFKVAWETPDRKVETVAEPAGATTTPDHLAIGTEDEDAGGVYLPKVSLDASLAVACPSELSIKASIRSPAFTWPNTVGAAPSFQSALRTVDSALSCRYYDSTDGFIDIETKPQLTCQTVGSNWDPEDDPDFAGLTEDCTSNDPRDCTVTCETP